MVVASKGTNDRVSDVILPVGWTLDCKGGQITASRGYKYLSFDDNICRSVVFKDSHGKTENFKHLVLTAG